MIGNYRRKKAKVCKSVNKTTHLIQEVRNSVNKTTHLIQEVRKSVNMGDLVQRSEVLPDGLEQGANDEDVVEGRQADEDAVEDGGHSFAQQDRDRDEVSGKSDSSNDDLQKV